MTKHTQTPWCIHEGESTGAVCVGAAEGTIAVLENNPTEGIHDERNGAFIVRACNAHVGLLEACEKFEQWLAFELRGISNPPWDATLRDLRAAITKAKGTET